MSNKTITLAVAAAISVFMTQPATAQTSSQNRDSRNGFENGNPTREDPSRIPPNPYDEGYRAGYSAGYDTASDTQRHDNRPPDISGTRGIPDSLWRQRYTQAYTYNDDNYYRTCQSAPDPAGVIPGAPIGGTLGNAATHGNGEATAGGVIVEGALGAAMTRNLDCEDKSYAYKTYHDGFNSGRPNSTYQWRNPRNGHYGNFRIVGYASDPDGFRCANYSQQIYIDGFPQNSAGRACQQPDGTWAIIG